MNDPEIDIIFSCCAILGLLLCLVFGIKNFSEEWEAMRKDEEELEIDWEGLGFFEDWGKD